jgi:hypothetical protein
MRSGRQAVCVRDDTASHHARFDFPGFRAPDGFLETLLGEAESDGKA